MRIVDSSWQEITDPKAVQVGHEIIILLDVMGWYAKATVERDAHGLFVTMQAVKRQKIQATKRHAVEFNQGKWVIAQ